MAQRVNSEQLVKQLDVLLTEFEALQRASQYDDLSDLKQESRILAARLQAALDRMAPAGSAYYKSADNLRGKPNHVRVLELSGIAYALREDLKAGWTDSIVELVHATTNAEMLDMAIELHRANYKDAAAIVAGTALELHLRAMCPQYGLSASDPKGRAKKADLIKSELRKTDAFGPLVEKQISVWLGVRNAAAHGDYEQYDSASVQQLISDVSNFVVTNPA